MLGGRGWSFLVILALVFLPRYLKSELQRFLSSWKLVMVALYALVTAAIFIIAYMLILLPFVLFLGANGLNGMLGLHTQFGVSDSNDLDLADLHRDPGWSLRNFGGLKAIAVSGNNGGTARWGFVITYFSLKLVAGDAGLGGAFEKIAESDPDAFQSLGTSNESTHWPTLFTGVLLLNFFYWTTNQQIIQRTFGAKNLAEDKKRTVSGVFKILAPLILVLPGIAAYLVIAAGDAEMIEGVGRTGDGAWNTSRAYGAGRQSVTDWLLGFSQRLWLGPFIAPSILC